MRQLSRRKVQKTFAPVRGKSGEGPGVASPLPLPEIRFAANPSDRLGPGKGREGPAEGRPVSGTASPEIQKIFNNLLEETGAGR
jgi:hypothetical protein